MVLENNGQQQSLDEAIEILYPPDSLDDIYQLYLSRLLEQNPVLFGEWGLSKRNFEGLSIRKKEIAKLFSIILSEKELLIELNNSLPYMVSRVLYTITWEGKKDIDEINRRTKGHLYIDDQSTPFTRAMLNPEYCLFTLSGSEITSLKGEKKVFLDLPQQIRRKLKVYLEKPAGYYLKPLKNPEKTDYIFRDQGRVLDKLHLLYSYIEQGNLHLTKSGLPRKSDIAKLQNFMDLKEFYIESDRGDVKYLRSELLVHFFLLTRPETKPGNPLELLKMCFEKYVGEPDFPHLLFLSHLKGWYHTMDYLSEHLHTRIFNILPHIPSEKWVSINQIRRFCRLRDIDLHPVEPRISGQHLFLPKNWKGWGNTKQFVTPEHYEELIILPLLRSVFFMYAALGLVDTAYDFPLERDDEEEAKLPYVFSGGLKYVSLTMLGEYVTGVRPDYHYRKHETEPATVTLDEKRLIIFLSKPDRRLELLLQKVAEKIGLTSYKVDYTSFLKECDSEQDIVAKIEFFKRNISSSLPANWTEFFQSAKTRTLPALLQGDMLVFKVPEENQALVETLTKDKDIRNLILLAESYHFLVHKDHVERLRSRLEFLGFLF